MATAAEREKEKTQQYVHTTASVRRLFNATAAAWASVIIVLLGALLGLASKMSALTEKVDSLNSDMQLVKTVLLQPHTHIGTDPGPFTAPLAQPQTYQAAQR